MDKMNNTDSNNPISDRPETPPPPKLSMNALNQLTVISMAVFILMALAIVGFLYYQNQQLKSMLVKYQAQPTTSPTPIATTDPTANWKTYTDVKLAIEFMYPSDLTTKNLGNSVVSFSDSQNKTKFSFSGFQALSSTQYQKYTQDRKDNGGFLDQKIFIDPQGRAWQTDIALGQVFNFTGILNQQNKYYVVSLQSGLGEEADGGASFRNFASQILSTFKFTSPTPSPVPSQKACTMEAKICPDGSSVGRTGPNCDFAPCPTPY